MHKLPEKFINRIKNGFPNADELLTALNETSPISVRLNPGKPNSLNKLKMTNKMREGKKFKK